MKNHAKKAAAAFSFLAMGASAEAMTEYNNTKIEKHAEIENLAEEVQGSVATTTDFQNPAHLEQNPAKNGQNEKLDSSSMENPFTAEELAKINSVKEHLTILRMAVAKSTGTDKITAQKNLDNYRAETDCQDVVSWYKEAIILEDELSKTKQYEAHDDRDYTRETGERTTARDRDNDTKDYFIARNKIKQTRFTEKQEGITSMDATFAGILANPKYAGKVRPKEKPELSKELAKEVFAGFSTAFQEVFMSMNINLVVKKYDDEMEIYFEYGIREDYHNEVAKVVFLDNTRGTNTLYIEEVEGFGKVLAQQYDDKLKLTQQLREKDGDIGIVVIDEDGIREGFNSFKAKKNQAPTEALALN